MRVFVSGATGVIGRRVVPLLAAAGHRVTSVVRMPDQCLQMARLGATPARVSLFDRDALRKAVAGHDVVVNLATHMPRGLRMFLPGAWRENDRVRRVGSACLVEAAIEAGAERFIQESFALVYPDHGEQWIAETTPIVPALYNRSVADAENSADRFNGGGRAGLVLRFAGFYGPDSPQVRDMIRVVRKGWAPLPGSPDAFYSSVSHDDAATAVIAALAAPAGVYNVADDEPLRRREYFGSLARALGVAPPKFPPVWAALLAGSLGETLARSLRISNRKLREECGWAPRFPSAREGWPAVVEALR